ncbi:MAG: hypothetical protein JSV60_07445, partial [Desulfobacterales bacterium]
VCVFRLSCLFHGCNLFGSVSSQLPRNTLIKRKLRLPRIQGVKGEAVVSYCELLTTLEMGYHRLFQRVNKMKI